MDAKRLLAEKHRWYQEGMMLFCDRQLAKDYADACVRAYKSGRLPLSKLTDSDRRKLEEEYKV